MEYTRSGYEIEAMRPLDIPEVMAIERLSFPNPWPASAYRYELRENDRAHYFVARPQEARSKGLVLGYSGFWLAGAEAHISTIAVHPNWRREGLGELLLQAMIEKALSLGAELMTLEVRVSNTPAQELYRKYGFQEVGVRKGYYSNNREDARLMTIPDLQGGEFAIRFSELSMALATRLRGKDTPQLGPARR